MTKKASAKKASAKKGRVKQSTSPRLSRRPRIEITLAGRAFHLALRGPVSPPSLRFARNALLRAALVTARGAATKPISRALAIRRLSLIQIKSWKRRGIFGPSLSVAGLSIAPLSRDAQAHLVALVRFSARRGGPLDFKRVGGYRDPVTSADSADVVITDEEADEDAANEGSDIVVTEQEADEDSALANSDVEITDEEAQDDWNEAMSGTEEPGLVSETGVEAIIDLISDGLPVAEGAIIVEGVIDQLYEWLFD